MRVTRTGSAFAAAILATAAAAAPAVAQDAADAASDASAQVGDIIVTAQKRATGLQDTPIAISAFDSSSLEERNIVDAASLAVAVPGLTLQAFQGNALLTIRGVSSDNITSGGDPATAFHVDGVYYARTTSAEGLFYDLERIEVLRGPQGTLYGRNATGGSVNLISRRPEFGIFKAEGDLTYGNYDRIRARAILNIPLAGQDLSLRISGVREVRDGYMNVVGQPDARSVDDLDTYAIRGQLRWGISDRAELTVRSTLSNAGGEGPAEKTIGSFRPVIVSNPADPLNPFVFSVEGGFPTGLGGNANPADPRDIRLNRFGGIDVDTFNVGATFDWELPFAALGDPTFRVVTGYQKVKYNYLHDSDNTDADILVSDLANVNKQYSVEAQLIGPQGATIEWIIGGYFFHEDGNDLAAVDYSPFPVAFGIPAIPLRLGMDLDSESIAVFGQATWRISERFRATLGLRQTRDEKAVINSSSFGGPASIIAETKVWNATTGKFGLDFDITPDNLLYGSISRGYKGGGFSLGQPSFDPEYIWSYEIGSKNKFADGRLQLNLAAFYYDYSDLQVTFLGVGPGGAPTLLTENAAKATIYGAELEMSAAVTRTFRIDASLAYLHSEFDEYLTVDPSDFAAGIQNLAGYQLPYAPEWSATISAQNEFSLGDAGTLTPRIDFYWSDHTVLRPFALPVYDVQSNYSRTNLSLTWTSANEQWTGELFVQNLENSDVKSRAQYIQVTNQFRAAYQPPRTYGVRVGVKF